MLDPTVRPGIRKKASLRMGRKTVRLNIGQAEELFTLHEELICESPFFRTILQPQRKVVEGDCPVCHEALDATRMELTYCSTSCGGNFHRACIDDWIACAAQGKLATACPLCRQPWADDDSNSDTHRLPTLDADAFDVFLTWLYAGSLPPDLQSRALINAHVLGEHVSAPEFCTSVVSALIGKCVKDGAVPHTSHVWTAYTGTSRGSMLRKAMVVLYLNLSADKFLDVLDDECRLLPDFKWDLLRALAAKRDDAVVGWDEDALKAEVLS
ncbi:uncharacterized protein M421DRAFT_9508 [Didymella exigua CBS 183.55]|uniref:RING-type domain-containing protein n=1 Tax=Didymella exigua CBS 183.55 TaxID=1150837 RepID=A0A6A5R8R1_9PLEO|nr:uncharacterized protein M421DRAFT_9508 [Didymella exigua CBS 183.55]KAF1923558.1 hypothetical protein M421DRAFT_9508 [Didymella exigua CBS 183.55]